MVGHNGWWRWDYFSAVDPEGRMIWIADENRDDEKRFVGGSDEKVTAFLTRTLVSRKEGMA